MAGAIYGLLYHARPKPASGAEACLPLLTMALVVCPTTAQTKPNITQFVPLASLLGKLSAGKPEGHERLGLPAVVADLLLSPEYRKRWPPASGESSVEEDGERRMVKGKGRND